MLDFLRHPDVGSASTRTLPGLHLGPDGLKLRATATNRPSAWIRGSSPEEVLRVQDAGRPAWVSDRESLLASDPERSIQDRPTQRMPRRETRVVEVVGGSWLMPSRSITARDRLLSVGV